MIGETEMQMETADRLEIVSAIYADQLAEDPTLTVEQLLSDFWFAPCVDDLPLGITPQHCGGPRFMFYSQIEAAALLG